jgi:3-deoxy-D-manno-octulosonic-acid transferase
MHYMQSLKKLMGTGTMHKFYQLVTTAAAPVAAAAFLCSSRGRIRLRERLGGWEDIQGSLPWWFHAASVGEVQGLLPILARLSAASAGSQNNNLLSCTSPTGLDRVGSLVTHRRILPFDAPWCVKRALDRTPADRLVLTETELWPELLRQALARGIRCSIVNGRISDYTLDWYRRLTPLISPLLQRVDHVCVPDQLQRLRYVALGVPESRVFVTGHTKYDVDCAAVTPHERAALREQLFPGISSEERVIVLGSVRPGEEQSWLSAVAAQQQQGAALRLIVAPRHAEKFEYFWSKIKQAKLKAARWSEVQGTTRADCGTLLLDTYGMLQQVYAASDLAFVGATLVDIGGHNPMESAMRGAPTCVGPYTSVIEEVLLDLEREGGVIRLTGSADIYALVTRLCNGDQSIAESGHGAYRAWQRHRGSTERVLSILQGP